MKFCLETRVVRRRARSWDLVLRSWPVDLIGGRRPCNTWYWLQTMAEKRVSSACPQSSDSGGVDGGKNPSLWALVYDGLEALYIRRVSKAPPDWWSVQQRVDKYGLPDIPERDAIETLRLQNSESIKRLGTALIRFSIWGLKESLSWIVTPSTTIWLTLCIPGTGGGGKLSFFDFGL